MHHFDDPLDLVDSLGGRSYGKNAPCLLVEIFPDGLQNRAVGGAIEDDELGSALKGINL